LGLYHRERPTETGGSIFTPIEKVSHQYDGKQNKYREIADT
jgi:hypothetical protein